MPSFKLSCLKVYANDMATPLKIVVPDSVVDVTHPEVLVEF